VDSLVETTGERGGFIVPDIAAVGAGLVVGVPTAAGGGIAAAVDASATGNTLLGVLSSSESSMTKCFFGLLQMEVDSMSAIGGTLASIILMSGFLGQMWGRVFGLLLSGNNCGVGVSRVESRLDKRTDGELAE
jgi:hypothetical protein